MSLTKDSIVVWEGIMVADPASAGTYSVTWSGTAFVYESAADPKSAPEPVRRGTEYAALSDKSFSVSGTAKPADGKDDSDKYKKYLITFDGGDGMDLGPNKTQDKKHEVMASLQWRGSPDGSDSLCFAVGEDGVGPFIGVGYMKPGNRIALARRYLDPSDSRASWTHEDIRKEVMKAIYDEEEEDLTVSPPWHCDVFKSS